MNRLQILKFCHYGIFILAIVITGYLTSLNFVPDGMFNSSGLTEIPVIVEEKQKFPSEKTRPSAPNMGTEVDSITIHPDSLESLRENRKVIVDTTINETTHEAKDWVELIIDFLETLSPLLAPVISYYFKRREENRAVEFDGA